MTKATLTTADRLQFLVAVAKSNPMIVSDLDGTIALDDHRSHLIETPPKRWKEYFLACDRDAPNFPVIEALKGLRCRGGYRIEIWSGRSDLVEEQTRAWLDLYGVPYDRLRLRPAADHRHDTVLKAEWLAGVKDDVFLVLEDRQRVVDMYREHGVACWQVAVGDF